MAEKDTAAEVEETRTENEPEYPVGDAETPAEMEETDENAAENNDDEGTGSDAGDSTMQEIPRIASITVASMSRENTRRVIQTNPPVNI